MRFPSGYLVANRKLLLFDDFDYLHWARVGCRPRVIELVCRNFIWIFDILWTNERKKFRSCYLALAVRVTSVEIDFNSWH
jgi:hypothetical protein